MKTSNEGVITILSEKGELQGIVYKDPSTRKNVFYTVNEMGFSEIEEMLKNNNLNIKHE